MKKFLSIIITLIAAISCTKLDEVWEELRDHEERIQKLETLCNKLNSNVEAIQTILTAMEQNDYVTDIVKVMEDGVEVGYSITFAKGGTVTIYHGTNGTDGSAPKVSIRKAADGGYYWTSDGEWMTDENGEMIPAVVADDPDGEYVTPQFRVADGEWYVSYDNGNSWRQIVSENNECSSCIIKVDCSNPYYITFVTTDGTIQIPTWKSVMEDLANKKIDFMNFISCCDIADKMVHFSCDDTYACLYDLILNGDTYTSIFENSFFASLKKCHDETGACFTLMTFNTHTEVPDYDISNVPTKFQTEFQGNKSWLRFAFHAENDLTAYATATGINESYSKFTSAIYSLTGDYGCIDRITRLGFFSGSLNNVLSIKNAEYGIIGLLAADDTRTSYYLSKEDSETVRLKGKFYDLENELVFFKTLNRNWYTAQEELSNNPQYRKITEFFWHEQEDPTSMRTWVAEAAKLCNNMGYIHGFPSDLYKPIGDDPNSSKSVVTVTSEPKSATIVLSSPGVATVANTGSATISVNKGASVTYTVSCSGYETQTGIITATSSSMFQKTVELSSETINGEYNSADMWISQSISSSGSIVHSSNITQSNIMPKNKFVGTATITCLSEDLLVAWVTYDADGNFKSRSSWHTLSLNGTISNTFTDENPFSVIIATKQANTSYSVEKMVSMISVDAISEASAKIKTKQFSNPGYVLQSSGEITGLTGTWIHSDFIPVEDLADRDDNKCVETFIGHGRVAAIAFYSIKDDFSSYTEGYLLSDTYARTNSQTAEQVRANITNDSSKYVVFSTDGSKAELYVTAIFN